MTTFKSDTHEVQTSPETLSSFLSTPENLYHILPQDRIEDWTFDDTTCSFKIKGLAHIQLKLDHASTDQVVYASNSEKPFPFFLKINTTASGSGTELRASFEADVNSMMGMMLKSPLTNFLNALGTAIQEKYAAA